MTNEIESKIFPKKCYQAAIKLLTRRDYSIFKLKEKLKEKDFLPLEISSTIEYLLEKKYLREDEYTVARIKAFIRKGYSKNYIELKLQQEKLYNTRDLIDQTFQELEITEDDQIKKLVDKRGSQPPEKLRRYLNSKGHQYQWNLED